MEYLQACTDDVFIIFFSLWFCEIFCYLFLIQFFPFI